MTRSPEHQRGITLIEMVATIVIMAIALVGITQAISGGIGRSSDVLIETRAVALAQSYLEEIVGKRFDNNSNPRGIPPCRDAGDACEEEEDFGGGGLDRNEFVSVSDYHELDEGWDSDSGTPLLDANGDVRDDYENFRVQVSVRYMDLVEDEAAFDFTDERDAKLVTVTVSHPGNPGGWDFSVYKANF